jgi:hypothetical protein
VKLFISYAHTDMWHVTQIVELLRSGGYDVWFDKRLLPGQDWKQELSNAIKTSDIFVYSLSPSSVDSEYCQWEFSEAVRLKKPIVPILIHVTENLPESILSRQFVDFSQGMTHEALARLMGGISHIAITIPTQEVPQVILSETSRPAQAERFIKHAFISYNRRDQDTMKQVRGGLLAAQIPVWNDEGSNTGADFQQEMVYKAIINAGCMVIILSPEAKKSTWVRKEVNDAIKYNIPIIPVVVQGTWAEVRLPQLSELSPIDLGKNSAAMSHLVEAVKKNISSRTEIHSKPISPAAPAKGFWDILLRVMQKERCIPFVGASLDQGILPSRRDIAIQWAKKHRYPFAPGYDHDLARVAHFLTVEMGGPMVSKDDIVETWLKPAKPPDFSQAEQLHSSLAMMGFPLFVTTSYNNFLFQALEHHGKAPQRVFFFEDNWQSSYGKLADDASVQKPMVFHLYGHYSEPESLILTDDDYLKFLVRISKKEINFPITVLNGISKNSYLFIGFTVTEWDLRILFHILSLSRRGSGPHIAVQIEPIQDMSSEEQEERMRAYLEGYFRDHLGAHVDIHVGNTKDFIIELQERWQREHANA